MPHQRTNPILELIWFQRVILDEFHETASWTTGVKECLKGFGADFFWGLSGIPPSGETESALEVADLLHYTSTEPTAPTMKEAVMRLKGQGNANKEWRNDAGNPLRLQTEARKFLNNHVRQNTSALVESIRVEQHEVVVEHAPEEWMIYRQACCDLGIFDLEEGYNDVDLGARATLLQRFAHFSIDADFPHAEAAVQSLGEAKRERISKVKEQLRLEAVRAAVLGAWPATQVALRSLSIRHASAAACVVNLANASKDRLKTESKTLNVFDVFVQQECQDGELRQRPEVRLRQPLREKECYANAKPRHALVHKYARLKGNFEADRILGGLASCRCDEPETVEDFASALTAACEQVASHLEAAYTSLDFYTWQLQGLTANDVAQSHECSICLCPAGKLSGLSILPCAHVFHTKCICQAVRQRQKCPECNQIVEARQVGSVTMELQPQSTLPKRSSAPLAPELLAHGSKLNQIARQIREIRTKDPTAKISVFAQWTLLENRIAEALAAYGVRSVQVPKQKGDARRAATALQRFQEEDGAELPYVLLLSLDRAASGSNLTAASHVVFVHPMNADTLATAVAYERQALGRVRRVGQTRQEDHVWRFVTQHTVEAHIHRMHRGEAEMPAAGQRRLNEYSTLLRSH